MRACLVALVLLAGCGGGESTPSDRLVGSGADAAYVLFPKQRPWRSVVVYFHGHGDADEITPVHHRPFLDHLTAGGTVVVYPTYETSPGGKNAARHALRALQTTMREVPELADLPLLGIGYSRGGHLVVDYAALAPAALKPKAMLSLMPASSEEPSPDLRRIPHGTRLEIIIAEHDEIVGVRGAYGLLGELAEAGFHGSDLKVSMAESQGTFQATHLSVFDTSPRARSAYWTPADRLIDRVRASG